MAIKSILYAPLFFLLAFRCIASDSINADFLSQKFGIKTSGGAYTCQEASYTTHILSKNPLVIYISSFVTPDEIAHLLARGADLDSQGQFRDSGLYEAGGEIIDKATRSSKTAFLFNDNVTECIKARARAFQGYEFSGKVEALQLVSYGLSEQYLHHYDWGVKSERESSIFVYLHANCTGGGTNFPRLRVPAGESWCKFIDCDEPYDAGVTFKPVVGNAIFWQNLLPDGTGDDNTLHAGLPLTSGTKVGLNIWTKQSLSGFKIQ